MAPYGFPFAIYPSRYLATVSFGYMEDATLYHQSDHRLSFAIPPARLRHILRPERLVIGGLVFYEGDCGSGVLIYVIGAKRAIGSKMPPPITPINVELLLTSVPSVY